MLQIAGIPIEGAAFDLEGTVIDLEPLHFAAHIETAKSVGVILDLDDPTTFTENIPHFIGGPYEALIEEIVTLAQKRGMLHAISVESRQQLLRDLSEYDNTTYRNLRDSMSDYS